MNGRKRFVGIAALALTGVLLTPLLGCHHPRRDSRSTRYHNQHHYDRERLAADQQRRHDDEQRRLDEQQRRERERRDWRRNY